MTLYIAADHRGFQLKGELVAYLTKKGYAPEDLGNKRYEQSDDYSDFAGDVARKVSESPRDTVGVVICGSGVGVDIVANKFPGVRSVLGFSEEQVRASRSDDDTNVIALPADYLDVEQAKQLVDIWLTTTFSHADRHKRRIEKIMKLERQP